jgi:Ras-related protein Rab-6A
MKQNKNSFEEKYSATVGFEFFSFNIRINNEIIRLQIWDTCGQEIYRSLITNFYRNSSLAIIVYSIDK